MSDPETPGQDEPKGPAPAGVSEESLATDGQGASASGPEESPVPARGERFGFDLGNPIERESATFSWLIVVILAAVSIGAIAKLISPMAAVIWAVILMVVLTVLIIRGLRHELGNPDDE